MSLPITPDEIALRVYVYVGSESPVAHGIDMVISKREFLELPLNQLAARYGIPVVTQLRHLIEDASGA
jgi:hypothetical protein